MQEQFRRELERRGSKLPEGYRPIPGANLVVMSVRAMEIFEGFAVFMVGGRGTTIGTAKQYGRTVRTDISNETGWDLKAMGDNKWGRLTRLFAKLEKLHPGKTRIRKPILQQDLLRIESGWTCGSTSKPCTGQSCSWVSSA